MKTVHETGAASVCWAASCNTNLQHGPCSEDTLTTGLLGTGSREIRQSKLGHQYF